MDQNVFVIKTFYSSGGSCVSMERKYGKEFSVCGARWRGTITGLLSLNDQEMCVINVGRYVNLPHMFVPHKSALNNRQ
jgi:hypothetical protein